MLNITVGGWGPNWGWTSPPESTQAAENGVLKCAAPFVINKQAGQIINVGCQAGKSDEHSLKVSPTFALCPQFRIFSRYFPRSRRASGVGGSQNLVVETYPLVFYLRNLR